MLLKACSLPEHCDQATDNKLDKNFQQVPYFSIRNLERTQVGEWVLRLHIEDRPGRSIKKTMSVLGGIVCLHCFLVPCFMIRLLIYLDKNLES